MKPLISRSVVDSSSFIVRTYSSPDFESTWHQHEEYELIVCLSGYGSYLIGNHIGDYHQGDVYFIGKNLPHWFRKATTDSHVSAVIVNFTEGIFGKNFLNLPELKLVKTTLGNASTGIVLKGRLREIVGEKLSVINSLSGFMQKVAVLECLHQISISAQINCLIQLPIVIISSEDQCKMHKVFAYTMNNFQCEIRIEEVAVFTDRGVSAFCTYFKKNTKKSYIQFLTEIRIFHACKLLASTTLPVSEICNQTGFFKHRNFNLQFKKSVHMSPLEYRKAYLHHVA